MKWDRLGQSWQQEDRMQGLAFDGAMILANFYLLGSIRTTPLEEFGDLRIGLFLGVGVITQFIGALLKKGPLQQRIGILEVDHSEGRENLMGCLSFIHFIFFLLVSAMSLALVGFVNLNNTGDLREFIWMLIAFVVATATSGTVWLAVRNPVNQKGSGDLWQHQELVANVFLWISASILTRFFWTALLFESEPMTYIGLSMRAMVLVAAVSALFMVFYVPARLLFLAEDYRYPLTWVRLWLVAMFPLISVVLLDIPR